MLFLDYTNYNTATIQENFGAPEYSYFFVRNAFKHVFERLGTRVPITDPEREVDAIYESARARGEDCAFFSFCPPNSMPLEQTCPTFPVFAWEYDTLPFESWNENPRENWISVLKRTGMAITHCSFSADAIRRAMGRDFPVWDIPAPLFEKFERPGLTARGWRPSFDFVVDGGLALSVGDMDLSLFRPERPAKDVVHALRVLEHAASEKQRAPQALRLEGVVYTTVLNPYDGRKNWRDLIAGFVWAFRDVPSATLLVKLTRFDVEDGLMPVLRHISTLGSFRCKVILIHGMLSNESYAALIDVSSYAVNAAFGEGQCLPLMEYMSAGRPAVAPAHTAMLDYVSPENAFVVACDLRPTHWPHDERAVKRCMHYHVRFSDLVRQFRESYRVAKNDPERYALMSAAATQAQRRFCSEEVALTRLRDVVAHLRRKRMQADDRLVGEIP